MSQLFSQVKCFRFYLKTQIKAVIHSPFFPIRLTQNSHNGQLFKNLTVTQYNIKQLKWKKNNYAAKTTLWISYFNIPFVLYQNTFQIQSWKGKDVYWPFHKGAASFPGFNLEKDIWIKEVLTPPHTQHLSALSSLSKADLSHCP